MTFNWEQTKMEKCDSSGTEGVFSKVRREHVDRLGWFALLFCGTDFLGLQFLVIILSFITREVFFGYELYHPIITKRILSISIVREWSIANSLFKW